MFEFQFSFQCPFIWMLPTGIITLLTLTAQHNIKLLPDVFNNLCHFSAEKRKSRTPRRTQQPKTLNTPEDSTYYTLIHVSHRKRDGDRFQIFTTTKLCRQLPCDNVTASPAMSHHNALLISNFFSRLRYS